jgi:hypothetical protein
MNDNLEKALTDCLSHIEIDYLSLNDVFRSISGFNNSTPTEIEFKMTLELVKLLLTQKDVVCLEGPQMTTTSKSIPELLDFLDAKWKSQEYDNINYGFWFDKKQS